MLGDRTPRDRRRMGRSGRNAGGLETCIDGDNIPLAGRIVRPTARNTVRRSGRAQRTAGNSNFPPDGGGVSLSSANSSAATSSTERFARAKSPAAAARDRTSIAVGKPARFTAGESSPPGAAFAGGSSGVSRLPVVGTLARFSATDPALPPIACGTKRTCPKPSPGGEGSSLGKVCSKLMRTALPS